MDQGADAHRLGRERDLFLRLLELGARSRDEVIEFLEGALALVVEVTGARKGYIELSEGDAVGAPRFWLAHGFADEEVTKVRRAISTGIIREALTTGRTISTASAVDDPRFRGHGSVQAGNIEAVLCAPIGPPPIGVVYLEGRPSLLADRAHAELFARHVAPLADQILARDDAARAVDHTAQHRARLSLGGIVGRSRALADVLQLVTVAAGTSLPVFFTGESGTGKSAFARALHESSARAAAPFVEINCAAIPETLFESELFGAEKGAHSTANRRIEGKIDAARGGTLFLDEVGEMPAAVQSKLLLFLQSRRYYRLGSTTPIDADVRVVAATNVTVDELLRGKRLREDLYYRLNVLQVTVPPLRERREDIGAIADAVVARVAEAEGGLLPLTSAAYAALREGEWPGNVRQLENILQRGWAVARSEGARAIEPRHLFPDRPATPPGEDGLSYEDAMRAWQRDFVGSALARYGWNVSEAARRIGLARSRVNELIRVLGISRDRG